MAPTEQSGRPQTVLRILESGPVTVVDFGDADIPDDAGVQHLADELLVLIRSTGCRVLAFDLSAVRFMPSGMLGLLAMLRGHVPEIHLYHPSDEVCQAVRVASLDKLLTLRVADPRPVRADREPVGEHGHARN